MKHLALSTTLFAAGLLAATLTGPTPALEPAVEGTEYLVDAGHSTVLFKCKHMGLSWARGWFDEFSGELTFDPEAPEKAKVSFTIEADSVDTNLDKRDEHLRGPDFFLVKQFPQIVFESDEVEAGDGGVFLAKGTVSWMGREVPTTATIEHVGQGQNAGGQRAHGFHAELTLKRSDFGMEYGLPDAIGDVVYVEIDTEVVAK